MPETLTCLKPAKNNSQLGVLDMSHRQPEGMPFFAINAFREILTTTTGALLTLQESDLPGGNSVLEGRGASVITALLTELLMDYRNRQSIRSFTLPLRIEEERHNTGRRELSDIELDEYLQLRRDTMDQLHATQTRAPLAHLREKHDLTIKGEGDPRRYLRDYIPSPIKMLLRGESLFNIVNLSFLADFTAIAEKALTGPLPDIDLESSLPPEPFFTLVGKALAGKTEIYSKLTNQKPNIRIPVVVASKMQAGKGDILTGAEAVARRTKNPGVDMLSVMAGNFKDGKNAARAWQVVGNVNIGIMEADAIDLRGKFACNFDRVRLLLQEYNPVTGQFLFKQPNYDELMKAGVDLNNLRITFNPPPEYEAMEPSKRLEYHLVVAAKAIHWHTLFPEIPIDLPKMDFTGITQEELAEAFANNPLPWAEFNERCCSGIHLDPKLVWDDLFKMGFSRLTPLFLTPDEWEHIGKRLPNREEHWRNVLNPKKQEQGYTGFTGIIEGLNEKCSLHLDPKVGFLSWQLLFPSASYGENSLAGRGMWKLAHGNEMYSARTWVDIYAMFFGLGQITLKEFIKTSHTVDNFKEFLQGKRKNKSDFQNNVIRSINYLIVEGDEQAKAGKMKNPLLGVLFKLLNKNKNLVTSDQGQQEAGSVVKRIHELYVQLLHLGKQNAENVAELRALRRTPRKPLIPKEKGHPTPSKRKGTSNKFKSQKKR